MTRQTGFSNVDTSERGAVLVDYLVQVAGLLADMRKEDYARLKLAAGSAVLDVGCGAGEVCIELAGLVGAGGTVCGVDASATMITSASAAANAAGCEIALRVADVYALPYADNTFDAVRAERVFQHLEDPLAALREMKRVARPGGRLMVIDPDHSQWAMNLESDLQRRVFEAGRTALLRSIVNPRVGTRLRALFMQAELQDVEQVVRSVEMSFPAYQQATFLRERLDAAVETGDITADEARSFVADLEAQHQAGTFFANVIGYTVSGIKR